MLTAAGASQQIAARSQLEGLRFVVGVLLTSLDTCPTGQRGQSPKDAQQARSALAALQEREWQQCTSPRSPIRRSAVRVGDRCGPGRRRRLLSMSLRLLPSARLSLPRFSLLPPSCLKLAANCGETENLLKCSRCHTVWFCGVKCQKVRLGCEGGCVHRATYHRAPRQSALAPIVTLL